MPTYQLRLEGPRPYFAEFPYYLWGEVNYDSEGDCRSPTDRDWTWLELTHRETDERLCVGLDNGICEVDGPNPAAARAARLLMERCGAIPINADPGRHLGEWRHRAAMTRADAVRQTFERPELRPFDCGHMFWGGWKWIGWFATDFTWVERWIMLSVLRNDPRAVYLCIRGLQKRTIGDQRSEALRYALARLTGESFQTNQEWVQWYGRTGRISYPEPDFDRWLADLKGEPGPS